MAENEARRNTCWEKARWAENRLGSAVYKYVTSVSLFSFLNTASCEINTFTAVFLVTCVLNPTTGRLRAGITLLIIVMSEQGTEEGEGHNASVCAWGHSGGAP